MDIIQINKREFKNIIKKGYTYVYNDRFIKLDKIYIDNFRYNKSFNVQSGINRQQIQMLCDRQEYIKNTSLPKGIVQIGNIPIGVIYKYFDNYKSFREIGNENIDTIYNNIINAINYNEELINNGVYNYDLNVNNVLYNYNDVQLIDLDGKYIKIDFNNKVDYNRMYSYFLIQLKYILLSKTKGELVLNEIVNYVDNIKLKCK